MYCEICKRNLDSFFCMPIHQHEPDCPIRLEWEMENGGKYPGFIGKKFKEIRDSNNKLGGD